jgi:ribose 5-phosphate isomerase RpiB
MRCAIGADDAGPLTSALLDELQRRGCEVARFGALRAADEPANGDTEWASIGRAVGEAVADGRADVGIVC